MCFLLPKAISTLFLIFLGLYPSEKDKIMTPSKMVPKKVRYMESMKSLTGFHILILKLLNGVHFSVSSQMLIDVLQRYIPCITQNFAHIQFHKMAANGLLKITRIIKKSPENLFSITPAGQKLFQRFFSVLHLPDPFSTLKESE